MIVHRTGVVETWTASQFRINSFFSGLFCKNALGSIFSAFNINALLHMEELEKISPLNSKAAFLFLKFGRAGFGEDKCSWCMPPDICSLLQTFSTLKTIFPLKYLSDSVSFFCPHCIVLSCSYGDSWLSELGWTWAHYCLKTIKLPGLQEIFAWRLGVQKNKYVYMSFWSHL